jgi:glycosyltransferase involved in cell wall biosynthesis
VRICLNADMAASPGGVGRYVRELIDYLRRSPTDDVTFAISQVKSRLRDDVPYAYSPRPVGPFSSERHQLRFARAISAQLQGLDLYHEPYNFAPRWPKACARILTIHDLLPLTRPLDYRKRDVFRHAINCVRKAGEPDLLLADSEVTRLDIAKWYGKKIADRTQVIHLGVDHNRFRPSNPSTRFATRQKLVGSRAASESFLIGYIGLLSKRKGVDVLLQASAKLPPGALLAVGGNVSEELAGPLAQVQLSGNVVNLGFVPEKDLPHMLAAFDLFVFPSPREGFGLPPLEAMACGTPVLCADAPTLRETLQGTAHYFAAGDPSALASALQRLHAEFVRGNWGERSRRATQRTRHLSWAETCRKTRKAYETAIRN